MFGKLNPTQKFLPLRYMTFSPPYSAPDYGSLSFPILPGLWVSTRFLPGLWVSTGILPGLWVRLWFFCPPYGSDVDFFCLGYGSLFGIYARIMGLTKYFARILGELPPTPR